MLGPATAAPRALELGIRLALAYALAIVLARAFGRDVVEFFLPLIRNVLASLDEREQIAALVITHSGPDTMVKMDVRLLQDIVIQGRRFEANGFLFTSTIGVGLILQPAIISLGLAHAWPIRRPFEYSMRFGVAAVLLAIVLVVDAPFTLWANYLHVLSPDSFLLLWRWEEFLVHGGRLALGLVIATASIRVPSFILSRHAIEPVSHESVR